MSNTSDIVQCSVYVCVCGWVDGCGCVGVGVGVGVDVGVHNLVTYMYHFFKSYLWN